MLEWVVSGIFHGMCELLLITQFMMGKGHAIVNAAARSDRVDRQGRAHHHRGEAGSGVRHVCRERFGVDLHWCCSSDEGATLCCNILGPVRAHDATHDYFLSLILDDVEEEDVAGPVGNRGVLLEELARKSIGKHQKVASKGKSGSNTPGPGTGQRRGSTSMPPPQSKGKDKGKGKANARDKARAGRAPSRPSVHA